MKYETNDNEAKIPVSISKALQENHFN